MKITGGVTLSGDKYGIHLHVCKVCGYLRWHAFDESMRDDEAHSDEGLEFDGEDGFIFDAEFD